MRSLWQILLGLLTAFLLLFAGIIFLFEERVLTPDEKAGAVAAIPLDQQLATVNTSRIGTDDPFQTAVAVAQTVYPATEEENVPGAVVLARPDDLAMALLATSRIQHFPVNAPLLYVEQNTLPEVTRNELLRLKPEGVPMDSNVQVYLVGNIDPAVRDQIEELGLEVRSFLGSDPVELSERIDDWTSTLEGDHRNNVVVANLENLQPAIPSAFWNAHAGDSLVFVTNSGVPEETKRMLGRRAHGPWLYLFGDESVISAETAAELAYYGHVTRVPGADAAATSLYFAGFRDTGEDFGWWIGETPRDFGWDNGDQGRNATFATLDGPGGWANALAATTLSHMGKHGPLIVIQQGAVPDNVRQYLERIRPIPSAPPEQILNHGWIIGGEGSIAWQTQAQIDLLLEAFSPPPSPGQ